MDPVRDGFTILVNESHPLPEDFLAADLVDVMQTTPRHFFVFRSIRLNRERLHVSLDVAGVVKDEKIVPAESYDPSAFLRDLSGVLYWAERILNDKDIHSYTHV